MMPASSRVRFSSRAVALVILAACGKSVDATSPSPDGGGGAPADGGAVEAAADARADAPVDATTEDAWASDAGASVADAAGADVGADAGADATADGAAADATSGGSSRDAGDLPDSGDALDPSVLQFHKHATRDGVYVDPAITVASAQMMHVDPSFSATLDSNVYAQPLYVEDGPGGVAAFVLATEMNSVYALDVNGAQLWKATIGTYAVSAEMCGNIKPLGITGTPVIDLARRAIYVDAAIADPTATKQIMIDHEIHALSLDDGSELPGGWPVKASTITGVAGAGPGTLGFQPKPQNQRGALMVLGDTLYVPYGGHSGDCVDKDGDFYHGWLIGVPLDAPTSATAFVTESERAGIWSVGGFASDGRDLYVATGNGSSGKDCPSTPPVSPPSGWAQQEAVLRIAPGPVWSGQTPDYWAPVDWPCLDNLDFDVGGSTPVLIDLPGSAPSHLVVASGKDGYVYVLGRDDLGGVRDAVVSLQVSLYQLKMAPTAYTTPAGTYVVVYSNGKSSSVGCPSGQAGNMVGVRITGGSPPTAKVAWCADEMGQGSPIFTTSDGTHDGLVWAVGAETSNKLAAWDADTGALVFRGTETLTGSHHFSTIIAVHGRIFTAADETMYAFTSAP
jgi:hypothetical protein